MRMVVFGYFVWTSHVRLVMDNVDFIGLVVAGLRCFCDMHFKSARCVLFNPMAYNAFASTIPTIVHLPFFVFVRSSQWFVKPSIVIPRSTCLVNSLLNWRISQIRKHSRIEWGAILIESKGCRFCKDRSQKGTPDCRVGGQNVGTYVHIKML